MRVKRPKIGWLVIIVLAAVVLVAAYGQKHYDLADARIVFLVAPSITQTQFVASRDYFRDCGATTVTVSLKPGSVPFYYPIGSSVPVDRTVDQVSVGDFDALVIPGGTGFVMLAADEATRGLIKAAAEAGKILVGMSEGPVVLDRAGVLEGRTVTYAEHVAGLVTGAGKFDKNLIVRDGNVFTAQDHASPVDVAKQVAKVLAEKR